jgi:hypothetical protein
MVEVAMRGLKVIFLEKMPVVGPKEKGGGSVPPPPPVVQAG